MKKEASFWKKCNDSKVECRLCAHNCKIKNENVGICGVRKNENGTLYSLIYGSSSSLAVDPIEKKPFYHFYPKTNALSLGTVGCNFKCLHCQNYHISTAGPDFSQIKEISADMAVVLAKQYGCQGIAYTYNEPTIWYEFTKDSAELAKRNGLYTAYVTNGYISEDSLREISSFLDAMNVDVKAFSEDFYKKVCKAKLNPVLRTCELAKELGIHIEITYLVIPGLNDSTDEIRNFLNWVVEKIGNETPVHFSRFHPDYNMKDIPRTPMETMLKIYDLSKEIGIKFAYLGNVPNGDYENTICPKCGNIVIERKGFDVDLKGFDKGKCKKCRNSINIIV